MRLRIALAVLSLGIVPLAPRATASQVQGHLFTARAMSQRNPELDAYLIGDRDAAYRWGAVAPDTLWITYIRTSWLKARMLGLVNPNMAQHPGLSTLNDTHNEPDGKSLDLCLAMLREASTPYEGAYALGWVTHWITDSHVHDLVNTWGGYFHAPGPDMFRHKALEALECKHVLSAHADVVSSRGGYRYLPSEECQATIGASGRWATNLVLKAFRITFPDNTNYTSNAGVFLKAFATDEKLVQRGSLWFYKESVFKNAAEQGEAKASLSPAEQGLVKDLIDLPTEDVYRQILNPFALVVTTGNGKLDLQLDVADNKMYGRFLLEWEAATQAAIEGSRAILPACVRYVKAHSAYIREPASAPGHAAKGKQMEADLQAIGVLLTDINPNREMDLPRKDYKQRRPPNICFTGSEGSGIDFSRLYSFTNLFWDGEIAGPAGGAPTRLERLNLPLNAARALTSSEINKAINDIVLVPARGVLSEPLPGGGSDGACKVIVYTSTNRLKERVDFVVSGADAGTAQGEVMLGDIIDVQVPLPPGAAGTAGTQRWIITQENDRFFYSDLPAIRDAGFDMIPTIAGRFRFDGQTLEQKIQGNTLSAKVQFTAMSVPALLGHQTLTLVCIPATVGTLEQACDVDRDWTIRSGTNMTSDQAMQLMRMIDTFKEQMKGKGLTSQEETVLINERYTIVKKSLGVDVGPLDMRLISAGKPIVLVPPVLRYTIPAGWKTNDWSRTSSLVTEPYVDGPQTGPQTCILTLDEDVKSSDGKSVLLTLRSCLYARFGSASRQYGDTQLEERVKAQWPSPTRTVKVTTANGFSGQILEKREDKTKHNKVDAKLIGTQIEDDLHISVSGGGLLRKGKEFLLFTYYTWSFADRLVVFENHKYDDKTREFVSSDRRDIGDGRDQAKQKVAAAIADTDAVLAGLKLVKDPDFKLQPSRLFVPGPVDAITAPADDDTSAAPEMPPGGGTEAATPESGAPDVAPQPPGPPGTTAPADKPGEPAPAAPPGPTAPATPGAEAPGDAAGQPVNPTQPPAAAPPAKPGMAPPPPAVPREPATPPAPVGKTATAGPGSAKPGTAGGSESSKPPSVPSANRDTAGGVTPAAAPSSAPVSSRKPSSAVKPASTSLELLTSTAAGGDIVKVRIVNPPKEKFAWIGFYKREAGHKDYLKYSFLNNLDDNVYEDAIAPDEEGEYDFRVFRDESYEPLATSEALKVTPRP